MSRWTDPAWRREADLWIHEQLAQRGTAVAGAIDQHHVFPWATAMRVPTDDGDVYFKANDAPLRHEAALVTFLARRRPDCIPPLLAADFDRGWMLMADAGTRLRDLIAQERDLSRWLDVLRLYAGVQLDVTDAADELVALGVPDVRLSTLPSKYEQLLAALEALSGEDRRRLERAVPRVRELAHELAAFGIPETVQHDDFHDGQVYVRDGRYLLLDWGYACVSHPFFTMAVTLEGVIAWGLDDVERSVDVAPFRDAYLAPFERVFRDADLAAACSLALRLGWVARAVNAHLAGGDENQTLVRLRMFVQGSP